MSSTIVKPRFATLQVDRLESRLLELHKDVERAQQPDGSVDVDALARASEAAGDEVAARVLDMIGADKARPRESDNEPAVLGAGEVKSVMQSLIDAKRAVASRDDDGDGVIGWAEAQRSGEGRLPLFAEILQTLLGEELSRYAGEMRQWAVAVSDGPKIADGRRTLDKLLGETLGARTKSQKGADALLWWFREQLVEKGLPLGSHRLVDPWPTWLNVDEHGERYRVGDEYPFPLTPEEATFEAERNPFVRAHVKRQRGWFVIEHLSDKEVARFVGSKDLDAFVAEKEACVRGLLGGSFEDVWLGGSELAVEGDVRDPDLVAYHDLHARAKALAEKLWVDAWRPRDLELLEPALAGVPEELRAAVREALQRLVRDRRA